jgi:hypothetical protein
MGRRPSCMAGGGGQPFRIGKAGVMFDVVVKDVENNQTRELLRCSSDLCHGGNMQAIFA